MVHKLTRLGVLVLVVVAGSSGCGGSDSDTSDAAGDGGQPTAGTGGTENGNDSGGTGGLPGGSTATGGSGNTGPGDCGDSLLITYATTGTFTITDTLLGLGDGSWDVGPGEVQLRFFDTDADNEPDDGVAVLVSYTIEQEFVQTGTVTVTTDTTASAGPDACGVASGQLEGSSLVWDDCTYGDAHGTTDWGPDGAATGPGCIANYNSAGTVTCEGSLCSAGDLVEGENQEDATWSQPVNTFEFEDDFSSFVMRASGGPGDEPVEAVEIPNDKASRTWLQLDGTEIDRTSEPMPTCLCP